jgi:hypothetical protein
MSCVLKTWLNKSNVFDYWTCRIDIWYA